MGWITLNDFKSLTNITIDDEIVEQALTMSFKTIIRRLFISQRYEYNDTSSKYVLNFPIADIDGDGVVGSSDIDIWEEDTDYTEYDLNANVVSVTNNRRRSIIEMDGVYPTTGRKLYIDYKTSKFKISEMIDELKELQKLLTVDYLFTTVPYSKLQRGISNWTINGVSVSFDLDAMNRIKEQNMMREKQLFNQLRKVRVDGVAIGRTFHDNLDILRHGVNFRR